MTSQLLKIKNTKNVDAVLNAGFGQGPAIVTKNYKQLNIKQPLYQSHGVASKKYIEVAGASSEGVRLVAPPIIVADKLSDNSPIKKVALKYKNEYEKAYNSNVSSFGGYAYDSIFALVEAIKQTGSTNPSDIRNGLENISNFNGVNGVLSMSKSDHLGLDTKSGMVLLEIQNSDWTIVK